MVHKELHIRKKEKSHRPAVRPWLTVFLLSLFICASVLGTAAYMQAHSHISNTFTVAVMNLEVDETFKNNEKSDVKVLNQGDVPAYLRAAVAVNWKDEDGNILSSVPAEGEDYNIIMGTDWTKGSDGYWYCKSSVAAGNESPVLIEKCTLGTDEEGKRLSVDILVQGVQAEPSDAVNELWGAAVSDGILTPPNGTE